MVCRAGVLLKDNTVCAIITHFRFRSMGINYTTGSVCTRGGADVVIFGPLFLSSPDGADVVILDFSLLSSLTQGGAV